MSLIDRLPARLREFANARISRGQWVGIVCIGLLLAARIWAEDQFLRGPLAYLARGWQLLLWEPIGFVGLVFFATLLAAIGLAFVDTSPTAEVIRRYLTTRRGATEARMPLSQEEADSVHYVRVFWMQNRAVVDELLTIFSQVRGVVTHINYLGELLTAAPLQEDMRNMDFAVHPDSTLSLNEVHGRFLALYASYIGVLRWVIRIRDRETDVRLNSSKVQLATLESRAILFQERLGALAMRPRQSAISRWPADEAVAAFLRPRPSGTSDGP